MSTTNETPYLLDHAWKQERRRLELLEVLRDPGSVQRLERTGVDAGWHCLEVGAGRGSIARWLGRRVGPDGSVLAIDLDTDLLEDLDQPNIEVRRADVLELVLPAGTFDLVHTRAVLTHIPERTRAIRRMLSWLAPGGRLVLEELDWPGQASTDPSWTALLGAYEQATPTIDWACGRELVAELAAGGLDDVDGDAELDVIRGGTPLAEWYELTLRALRAPVRAAGAADDDEIDRQLTRLQDPAFRGLGVAWIGAWGRR